MDKLRKCGRARAVTVCDGRTSGKSRAGQIEALLPFADSNGKVKAKYVPYRKQNT